MTHDLLNSVAATTAHRDRDDLDRAVALLLLRFLEPKSVTVLRLVDDGITKRVARRVRVSQQRGASGPAPLEDTMELPVLTDFPAWRECAVSNRVVRCTNDGDGSLTTVFPVHGASEVVGLLVVETATALAAREADLVLGILGIVKNHLALLDYGELDTLTGLLNRKTFESHFHKLCRRLAPADDKEPGPSVPEGTERRSTHGREPSWLALVDIDHFKSINDGYGHLFGDEVLLLVSRLMRRSLRGADHLFRFGGEEFVVVLDRAGEAGVQIVFERLRAAVEQHKFPQVGRVTISIGYTRIHPRDISTTCVERADAALYYAKSHGRNNVRCWEALRTAGQLTPRAGIGEIELF
jgi:diguanylate cyclase (GGDEF)-like protein